MGTSAAAASPRGLCMRRDEVRRRRATLDKLKAVEATESRVAVFRDPTQPATSVDPRPDAPGLLVGLGSKPRCPRGHGRVSLPQAPRRRWRIVFFCVLGLVGLFLVAQAVPYGRGHSNPQVTKEPAWDSPATRDARDASLRRLPQQPDHLAVVLATSRPSRG